MFNVRYPAINTGSSISAFGRQESDGFFVAGHSTVEAKRAIQATSANAMNRAGAAMSMHRN
jgi:hypothetical protein